MRTTIAMAALVLLTITSTNEGLAQNETGARALNKDRFKKFGFWYDGTTAMYQVRYPIIRSLPPLNSGMPFDIILSYIYMDSTARFDTAEVALRKSETWPTMNDTLKGMIQYLYRVVDYNPAIFSQYLNEVNLKRTGKYVTNLSAIVQNTRRSMLRVAPNAQDRLALYSALYPDYILRVHVLSVDSMLGKPQPSPINPYAYRVTAEVIDTLKGRVFPPCGESQFRAQGDGTSSLQPTGNPCIQFVYYKGNYWEGFGADLDIYQQKDPAFHRTDGGFRMQAGQNAIVFIRHEEQLLDSTADYFHLMLEPQASYNALPIVDGMVRDVNHVWSANTQVSYADWKQRYLQIRDKIVSGNY